VRLDPNGAAEVVWAQRLDPVRARIINVPMPESGFFFGDVVLHDGAAVGHRLSGEHKYPVFNVFERFERSAYATVVAEVSAPSQADLDALASACADAGIECEDWTDSVTFLCRQCSEGIPHDHHDNDLPDPVWRTVHRLGLAVIANREADTLLHEWAAAPGRALKDVRCA
jgi:hypothetical protein